MTVIPVMSVAATARETATAMRGLGGEGEGAWGREREEILAGKEATEEGEVGGGGEDMVGKKGFGLGLESENGYLGSGGGGGDGDGWEVGVWGMNG